MSILVIAEVNGGELKSATLNTIAAAQGIAQAAGSDIHVLVADDAAAGIAPSVAAIGGVAKVLVANDAAYAHGLAEPIAALVVSLAGGYSHILAPSTTYGKNLLPRVAALLDVAQISDIVKVVSADTFVRPIYAGNALATVQSADKVKVITVRGTGFDAAPATGGQAAVETVASPALPTKSRFVSQQLAKSERPELTAAKIIVSGGRAMGSSENFRLIEEVADKLGAAVGASRAAVDSGFVSNDLQVGQTGKIVAPNLYIAVGISGAIQHLAGMSGSKVIVAINKDEEAPIFQVADYGLVGDLFQVLPLLSQELEKR